MVHLNRFCEAVSKRKPWNEKRGFVNAAIAMQLQELDIPRLMEVIRLMSVALWQIQNKAESPETDLTVYDAQDMWRIAKESLYKIEELAEQGDLKDWGDPKEN